MRRATHKPETESGEPAVITSRGSRNTAEKQKSASDASEEKSEASSHLPAAQPGKNAPKQAQGTAASAVDAGAELSYGFKLEANTGFGTVEVEVRIAAEKENARLDLELEKEGEEEDPVKLFDTAFKTGLSEEGFKNSIEGSVLSADVAEIELYKGVKVAINVSALNAELDDEEEAFSLFKVEGEISGKIEDPAQIKGTWMDTYEVRTLLSRGYSVGFSGSLSYTINDAAELKRIRDFIALRRQLKPLARQLEGAIEEVSRLKAKHMDYVAEQTRKFMEKNGIKQYADMTRKQRKLLKAFLKKNPVIKKMKVGIVAAKKTVRTTVKAIKPIVSKMKVLSKGMKSVAGKVAAKVGLKVASKLLLKAIPIINVISAVLDIITLIRFYDVTTAGGEGESPNFWDSVPDKRPEGEASGDSKKSGGSAPGTPGKEGQGTKPEGTEANGPGADVAKALEAESGDGTNKEVLSGDGEKEKETEAGKSSETESKNTTKEAETTKEEKEVAKDQKSGVNSGEKPKEEEKETVHFDSPAGDYTPEVVPHEPATDLSTRKIFPKKLVKGQEVLVTVQGTIISTGQTFTIDDLRVIIVDFNNEKITYKYPLGSQSFEIDDFGKKIIYIGFPNEIKTQKR